MKLAFVTPWYGTDISGGMESETRRTVTHLRRSGYDVEVLTTCIKDFYADWGKNYHKAGVEVIDGLTVHRFPVVKRNKLAFDQVNWQLMQGLDVSAESEQIYINEMFRSPALYSFIKQYCREYVFFFIPYMFATTYFGAQICPERSAIIPCLHDESYARMQIYRDVLPRVHTLVLHSNAERQLADQLYSAQSGQIRPVIGEGVDTDFSFDPERFRQKYGIYDPFVLYAGRRELGKNIPLLLKHWQRYTDQHQTSAKLLLIGPGELGLAQAQNANVIDLGFVSLQDKYDAMAAASLLCQPSVNESFSLVIMESWLTETPVLVHGACAVTKEHCQRSNGGLYFSSYPEFEATVNFIMDNPATAAKMGQNGREYVLSNYQWPDVINKFEAIIADIDAESKD